jgi:hypothetical protein
VSDRAPHDQRERLLGLRSSDDHRDDTGDDAGLDEAGRALLRAAALAVPVLSDQRRHQIRRRLEERLSPRGRWRSARKLALVLLGTVSAGSAMAIGLVQLRPVSPPVSDDHHARPTPRRSSGRARPAPAVVPTPPAPAPAPAPSARPPGRDPGPRRLASRALPAAPRPEARFPMGAPGLRDPGDLLLVVPGEDSAEDDDETLGDRLPAPPPPRLVIQRGRRREVSLVLAGGRVVGTVRGTPVALTIDGALITGRLGDRPVSLWLHPRHAQGQIGGLPARFELAETPAGVALRAGTTIKGPLPATSTRVVTGPGGLAWSPGCNVALPARGAGTYQGRCGSGGQARVSLPPAWQELPLLPRLILLSLFLTERDQGMDDLFGRPDWAGP